MYPYIKFWVCCPILTTSGKRAGVLKIKALPKVMQISTLVVVGRPQHLLQCENWWLRELNSHGVFGRSMCSRPQSQPKHHQHPAHRSAGALGWVIRTHRGHLWLVRCCRTSDTYHRKPGPISSAVQFAVPFFKLIYRRLKVTATEKKFARKCCQEANILMSDSFKCITLTLLHDNIELF